MTVIPAPRAGDIGKPLSRIELEPLEEPAESPVTEPAAPEPAREPVPA